MVIPEGLRKSTACLCNSSVDSQKCDKHRCILGRLCPTIPSPAAQRGVTEVLLTLCKQEKGESLIFYHTYVNKHTREMTIPY